MGDRLPGTVAIITGGTSGIGARSVEIFVEHGPRVLIAARSEDVGQALAGTDLDHNAVFTDEPIDYLTGETVGA